MLFSRIELLDPVGEHVECAPFPASAKDSSQYWRLWIQHAGAGKQAGLARAHLAEGHELHMTPKIDCYGVGHYLNVT